MQGPVWAPDSGRGQEARQGAWSGLARYSHYGEYTSSLYSYSGDDVATYGAKGLVDVELAYRAPRLFRIALGSRNLFDTYPDRMSYNNGFDIFPYPPASPFGFVPMPMSVPSPSTDDRFQT